MNLDAYFTQALTDSQTQSQKIGDYMRGGTDVSGYIQRHWMIPSRAGTFVSTDIANLGTAFSRRDLNLDYTAQHTNDPTATSGMVGNVIVDGLQINYLGMLERAFRERHKTDVRLQMHLCGRRLAHGDAAGIHVAIKNYTQNYIDNTLVTAYL